MFFENLAFILPGFQQLLLKRMLVFSDEMFFIENEATLLCVTAGTCKGIYSYNLVYNFLKQLLLLQSSVFVVQFSNAFWHGNEAFSKAVLRMKLFLLVIFHLPQSKCRNVKTYFYSCRYQNQNFPLASHSCGSCSTRVTLMSHLCRSCLTRVTLVLLVSHSCRTRVARVWHSYCNLDYILV